MRRLTGLVLSAIATWIGLDAIVTRTTWLWGSTSSAGGGGGFTADYLVRGTLAVIMGAGWLFSAVAAGVGLAGPDALRTSRVGYAITSISLVIFALCYEAIRTRLRDYLRGFVEYVGSTR
jgi:hypothetical protein